ncbi:MAG TPA: tetratricopeptide repeat protein, partial [Actinocrinis sp.]|uniref:tetratricopeptide repeat protein n=1 Tax=Actinocrinis sp. TaxID=1920516 RepID=UPI002DDD2721
AVRFAHSVAHLYPDGNLYVDLRGFDVSQPPLPATTALGRFLRALGADPGRFDADADELAGAYRSVLSNRRMLIVLDNAASASQVRALLPGTAGCFVVVTSRRHLRGLVARDGARRITLGTLDRRAAIDLLVRTCGLEAGHDAEPLGELAQLCGGLPLALRIAAERVEDHAALLDLIKALDSGQATLDLLATDDADTGVRAVFSWTYRTLDPAAARLFRLVSVHPGRDFSLAAAAALAGRPIEATRRLMDRLVDCHLIELAAGPDRFRFHDLLRIYATELCVAQDDVLAAAARLVAWYLATAVEADLLLSPQRFRASLDASTTAAEPGLADYDDAVRWCDAECDNLVPVTALATSVGDDAAAWRLAWALAGYFDLRRSWEQWLGTHRIGLDAARRCGDEHGEAAILTSLGSAYYYPRRFHEADEYYRRAQRLWRELGERRGEAAILNAMGNLSLETRHLDAAVLRYDEALDVYRAIGDRRGEGVVLNNLAETYCEMGRFTDVLVIAPTAVALSRAAGNQRGEAMALCHLGRAVAATSTFAQAWTHFRQAIEVGERSADQHTQAWALDYLGRAALSHGDPAEAARCWYASAALFDEIRDVYQAAELRARLAGLAMARL